MFNKINKSEKMIEIHVPTNAAVTLLTEQMEKEFEARRKAGMLETDFMLHELPYSELLKIAETAAFDILMLLPVQILTEESNISDIVVKAIRALAESYQKDSFKSYNYSDAEKLLARIRNSFNILESGEKDFSNN